MARGFSPGTLAYFHMNDPLTLKSDKELEELVYQSLKSSKVQVTLDFAQHFQSQQHLNVKHAITRNIGPFFVQLCRVQVFGLV